MESFTCCVIFFALACVIVGAVIADSQKQSATRADRVCRRCGRRNHPHARFCGDCGLRLDDAGATHE
jgi:hypothetical protein